MLCGAQIVICSDNAEFPELRLTTFGTKKIFEQLRGVRGCGTLLMIIICFAVWTAAAHKIADPKANDAGCRHGRKPALPQLLGSMSTTTACDSISLGAVSGFSLLLNCFATVRQHSQP